MSTQLRRLCLVFLLPMLSGALAAAEPPRLAAWFPDASATQTVLIRGERWVVPESCMPGRQLGAAGAERELGAGAAGRELGAGAAGRELGSGNAGRELGDAGGQRDLGSGAAGRDLGAGASGRELGAGAGERELGSGNAGRELGDAGSQRELGAGAAERELGAGAAGRELGAVNDMLVCEPGEDRASVVIRGVLPEEFSLPQGSAFRRYVRGPEQRSVRVEL